MGAEYLALIAESTVSDELTDPALSIFALSLVAMCAQRTFENGNNRLEDVVATSVLLLEAAANEDDSPDLDKARILMESSDLTVVLSLTCRFVVDHGISSSVVQLAFLE